MFNSNIAPIVKTYIDPGTGSAIFTVLVGLIGVIYYGLKGLIIKLKSGVKKGKSNDTSLAYVIYTDSKRYWNVFKPICDEFEKRKVSLMYLTQSKDDPIFNEKYEFVKSEFIGEGNKGFTKLNFLKADIVLSSTPSLDVYQWKRSKDVKYYIHIPHAVNDLTAYRMFGLDYYDAVLLNGEYQKKQLKKLEELRNINKKDMALVGCIYLDEMKKRLENTKKVKNKQTTVLLAPSWGASCILVKHGHEILDNLLKTGYKVIVRPHPQSYTSDKDVIDDLMTSYPQIEWNRDNDNFDVLNKSDILISDFSGVIFDFSLVFDKPIIYADTSFDNSIYDASWLDEQMWTFDILPSLGKQLNTDNMKNIKSLIDECISSSEYKKGREKARKDAWINVNNATKSTVDYIINKHTELIKKEEL